MKTLSFQQIADSRDGEDEQALELIVSQVLENLRCLPGVNVEVGPTHPVSFRRRQVIQYRADFWVTKDRQSTWEQVYRAVNAVRPVPFTFK